MKVGIVSWVADLNEEKVGVDSYAYNLIKNIINQGKFDDLYLIHYKRSGISSDWIYDYSHEVKAPNLIPLLKESLSIPHTIKKSEVDVLHIPEHHHQFTFPFFFNSVSKVLTIHDLTPILFPETHPTSLKFWWRWEFTLKLVKDKADFLIADSLNTKKDCITNLGVPEDKIKVVTLAASEIYRPLNDKEKIKREIALKYNISYPFILSVGTLEARKNHVVLIKAFSRLKKMGLPHKLVIVGRKGWKFDEIFQTVEKLQLHEDVIFTGYIPEEDVVKLYNLARLFVYPSLYEGFGLPPLEAMACGCPVITSNTSSLPEVVGDAGILIDPHDVEALANSMDDVLTQKKLMKKMTKNSLERSKFFNWPQVAAETWKVYEEVYQKNERN